MGRDNGNLLNSLGCDFTIGAVVARYKSDGRDIAPFTFIAADARDSDFDYYLEALDDEEASARVVKIVCGETFPLEEPPYIQYESVLAMLYAIGFTKKVVARFQYQREFMPSGVIQYDSSQGSRLELVAKIAGKFGLHKIFDDADWSPCYEDEHAALGAFHPPGYGFYLEWATDDPERFEALSGLIRTELAMNAVK